MVRETAAQENPRSCSLEPTSFRATTEGAWCSRNPTELPILAATLLATPRTMMYTDANPIRMLPSPVGYSPWLRVLLNNRAH